MTKNLVDLWFANLDDNQQYQRQAYALLSPDEMDRAKSFRFPIHKNRFVIRRGILRVLLGRYLGRDPEDISFVYGANGKPSLKDEPLHFNISHSEDLSCFAFSTSLQLGIDVELVRPLPGLISIAADFCSSVELSAITSLPPEDQSALFFRYWTRKEALVKALGGGLGHPVYGLDARAAADIQLASHHSVDGDLAQWHVQSWEAQGKYVGALASRSSAVQIVQRQYSGFW